VVVANVIEASIVHYCWLVMAPRQKTVIVDEKHSETQAIDPKLLECLPMKGNTHCHCRWEKSPQSSDYMQAKSAIRQTMENRREKSGCTVHVHQGDRITNRMQS
jgi:hypothetical protein